MRKIPTLYLRGSNFGVTPDINPDAEWVLTGEGIATEKLDGVNVRVTLDDDVITLEKRRNPTLVEKESGAEPGYIPASRDDPADRWIYDAMGNTNFYGWPGGKYICEAVGPKIQGNPLLLAWHELIRIDWRYLPVVQQPLVVVNDANATFDLLRDQLPHLRSQLQPGSRAKIEGVVFHHLDGRMAKIKTRDFK